MCRRMCNCDKWVGFRRGNVPPKVGGGKELGRLLWWAFGDGPGSLRGGNGGGELSRGGNIGAGFICCGELISTLSRLRRGGRGGGVEGKRGLIESGRDVCGPGDAGLCGPGLPG